LLNRADFLVVQSVGVGAGVALLAGRHRRQRTGAKAPAPTLDVFDKIDDQGAPGAERATGAACTR
jgi:hypothetical protein